MKTLKSYIVECLDNENIFFLLDTYFRNNDEYASQFYKIVSECIKNKIVSKDKLKELIKGTFLENELEGFVNFISNDVSLSNTTNHNVDYLYELKQIIEWLISNKSIQNKWNKTNENN